MSTSEFAIDTNAAVALMANNPAIQTRLGIAAQLYLPVTALGELFYGAERSARIQENLKRVNDFSQRLHLLPVDIDTARLYGRLNQALRIKGRPIPQNDIWIAACSIQHGLTLVTRDKHFLDVSDLTIIEW